MPISRIPRWISQSAIAICALISLTAVFAASEASQKAPAKAATIAAVNGVCPAGYSGSAETGCVDVDECAAYNGGCHMLTACENTPGSRTCGGCPEKFAGNGYVGCFDANECPNGDCSSRLPLGFEDAMPPVITTSGDVTVAATSAKGAIAKFTATAKDKIDGERPVACTPASGSTFPVGKTTVSCWSSNSLGKLKTSSLTVTVTK